MKSANFCIWHGHVDARSNHSGGNSAVQITNVMAWIDAISFRYSSFVDALDHKLTTADPSKGEKTLTMISQKNDKRSTVTNTVEEWVTTIHAVEEAPSLDMRLLNCLAAGCTTSTLQSAVQD